MGSRLIQRPGQRSRPGSSPRTRRRRKSSASPTRPRCASSCSGAPERRRKEILRMAHDDEREYVLRCTASLNGEVYPGGTRWRGYPSSAINDYVVMVYHGRKVPLPADEVAAFFRL